MTNNNQEIASKDFGIDTSHLSKEEQTKVEESLSVLIDAARNVIKEHKQSI